MKPKLKHVGWCLGNGKKFLVFGDRGIICVGEFPAVFSRKNLISDYFYEMFQDFKPAKVFVEVNP